jgi:GT2 family glycosyltransferase
MSNVGHDEKIFIVIPVLNRWEQTRACLNALYAGSFTRFSIIVVDHGSTDATREGLQNDFPDVIRVPGTTDMWWSAATNAGIGRAISLGADAVILLNNDCCVQHDTLDTLVIHHRHHPDAIIAPLQRNFHTGKILTGKTTTCFLLGFPTLKLPGKPMYEQGSMELEKTGLIMGGRGTLVPVAVFGAVGTFNDTELPHYGADHDFYLRARRQGISLFIARGALVDVDESTTTLSGQPGDMSAGEFVRSLRDRRSHRNIGELTALFRLHYPLPGLYPIGVSLNLLRYTLIYLASRIMRLPGTR